MISPTLRKPFLPLFTAGMAAGLLSGGSVTYAQGDKIDLSKFPGLMVDQVVVPIPSEILEVLDKIGSPNWRGEMRKVGGANSADRRKVALLLGTVVAEGFVAVQAEDRDAIEEAGKEVLRLSESLGIKRYVVRHAQSILDAAKAENWNAVRRELDNTERTVRDTMEKMRDEELSQCVSVGGWLRGTEVITSVIGKDYNKDRAELLNQPDLVQHFIREITGMKRKRGTLADIRKGLNEIAKVMGDGHSVLPKTNVAKIHDVSAKLVKKIISPGK